MGLVPALVGLEAHCDGVGVRDDEGGAATAASLPVAGLVSLVLEELAAAGVCSDLGTCLGKELKR